MAQELEFFSLDVVDQYEGLITGWIPSYKVISITTLSSTIFMKLELKNHLDPWSILNIYDPCVNHIPFWEDLDNSRVLSDPMMLVGGDFNFTLSLSEVWGANP
jgi:hypothetical protein